MVEGHVPLGREGSTPSQRIKQAFDQSLFRFNPLGLSLLVFLTRNIDDDYNPTIEYWYRISKKVKKNGHQLVENRPCLAYRQLTFQDALVRSDNR
jgi:hypothetical protein